MRPTAAICRELTSDHRPDGALLAAFLAERSEVAFVELVRRHGPLVWAACRRLLPDPADAEDAFQAAFLVLVRRAHRLTHSAAVGPWLYRVAVWTAQNVRRKNARRLTRQQPLPEHVSAPAPDSDLKADIDKALLALPARYRDSIVLCHLQGLTRREAAERLGCAEGTLSAWLNRGLAKLRHRLGDLDPAKLLGVAVVTVPAALSATTARAAVASSVAAALPPVVSSIVEGVLHMFWVKKAMAAAFALCAVFALGVGMGLGTRAEHTGATAQEKGMADPKAKPPAATEITPVPNTDPLEVELRQVELQLTTAQTALKEVRERMARNRFSGWITAPSDNTIIDALTEHVARLEVKKKELLAKKPAEPKPADRAKEIAALEALLYSCELAQRHALVGVEAARKKFEANKAAGASPREQLSDVFTLIHFQMNVDDVMAKSKEIKDKLAKLKGEAATSDNGYLVLTVSGQAGKPEFVLYEHPHADPYHRDERLPPVYGPVTTRDPEMLKRLLTRAKADPTGPQLARVIAEPQTALGTGPAAALKACDAAGYKSVTFTGYVFGGGFAIELKPDQKGDVRGYTRYDAAEKKPAELVKEIEEGAARF